MYSIMLRTYIYIYIVSYITKKNEDHNTRSYKHKAFLTFL